MNSFLVPLETGDSVCIYKFRLKIQLNIVIVVYRKIVSNVIWNFIII